jgi:hypothetical protein
MLTDFRRGPLGSHFDGFARYLKSKGYSKRQGSDILGKGFSLSLTGIQKS